MILILQILLIADFPSASDYFRFDECVICIERTPMYIIDPCGHHCLCKLCKKKLTRSECPYCRTPVSKFIKKKIEPIQNIQDRAAIITRNDQARAWKDRFFERIPSARNHFSEYLIFDLVRKELEESNSKWTYIGVLHKFAIYENLRDFFKTKQRTEMQMNRILSVRIDLTFYEELYVEWYSAYMEYQATIKKIEKFPKLLVALENKYQIYCEKYKRCSKSGKSMNTSDPGNDIEENFLKIQRMLLAAYEKLIGDIKMEYRQRLFLMVQD